MEEPLRVRVVFDDRKILTKSQRSEGLKRCWLLLQPSIATISDLESHVRRRFHLKHSCPNGLVLYMDDFVLPHFESTHVLKDKDIIRVRKKDAILMDVIELGDGQHYIQDSEVLEKPLPVCGDKLLTIREFGEDSVCKGKNDEDLCAHNENAVLTENPSKKKRKHSDGIQGSKKKKLKSTFKKPNITGDGADTAEEDGDIHLRNSLESSQRRDNLQGSSNKKDEPCTVNGRPGIALHPEDDVEQVSSSMPREKRNVQAEENIGEDTCEPHANDSATKVQYRNARRKKARRQWLREIKSQQGQVQSRNARRKKARRQWLREIKSQQGQNTQSKILSNDIHRESPDQQETEQSTEVEKEIVPVVIRPGHIRFQPLDDEKSKWQSQETMETLQWNGTTVKKGQKWDGEKTAINWNGADGYKEQQNGRERAMIKWNDTNGYKGQKWDREKKVTSKWNDANGYNGQKWPREKVTSKWNDANSYNGQKWPREKTMSKWKDAHIDKEQSNGKEKTMNTRNDANSYTNLCNAKASIWDSNNHKEQSNEKALSAKAQIGSSLVDFESLFPLTRIPQVGDVLAYRLIELSSSWCPEVSSFRVGQVTSYNHITRSIILVLVPEYPIFSGKDIERSGSRLHPSLYNENGSLQIHYPSLIDVRLLKATNSEATTSDCPGREMSIQEAALVNNWELAAVNSNANHSGREMSTQESAWINNGGLAGDNNNAKEIVAQSTDSGNEGRSTWDQIKLALNEIKAQLQRKDGWDEWNPNKSTASTSWSYSALRRSAVGPTLAYLRGTNTKNPRRK